MLEQVGAMCWHTPESLSFTELKENGNRHYKLDHFMGRRPMPVIEYRGKLE